MDERQAIERLRKIARHPAARGLADDAALLEGLVITHDSIAQGVHYLPDDPPEDVAAKLVAVNLSDLAAKGAEPLAALLSLTLRDGDGWDERFLDGIAAACAEHRLELIGGDTLALPAGVPRVLGLTAIGRAGPRVPSRAGGRPGDILWLAGTLGDSAAGLALLRSDPGASGPLVEAYRRPRPLIAAGRALAPHADAMMDVSDGLLLDLARLCAASGCGARIDLDALPLSAALTALRGDGRAVRLAAATGGDDYALLAAIPATIDACLSISLPGGGRLVAIGALVEGSRIELFDKAGPVPLPEQLGHEHRPS